MLDLDALKKKTLNAIEQETSESFLSWYYQKINQEALAFAGEATINKLSYSITTQFTAKIHIEPRNPVIVHPEFSKAA